MHELRKVEDCTHKLLCRHVIGRNSISYHMKCIPLGKMADGRMKVLVFGDRYWKGRDEIQKVRYVDAHRVSEM